MNTLRAIEKKTITTLTQDNLYQYIQDRIQESSDEILKLPPEIEIAKQMNVSRATVRQALSDLENAGLIIRIHGKGTFVNRHFNEISLCANSNMEYNDMIRACGFVPSAKLISDTVCNADDETVRILSLRADDNLRYLRSIYYADGNPCILNLDWFPQPLLPDKIPYDIYMESVYRFLSKYVNRICCSNYVQLYAATAQEATALMNGEKFSSCSLILAKTVFYDQSQMPVFYNVSYYDTAYVRFHLSHRIHHFSSPMGPQSR